MKFVMNPPKIKALFKILKKSSQIRYKIIPKIQMKSQKILIVRKTINLLKLQMKIPKKLKLSIQKKNKFRMNQFTEKKKLSSDRMIQLSVLLINLLYHSPSKNLIKLIILVLWMVKFNYLKSRQVMIIFLLSKNNGYQLQMTF